jgi:hypothetical protein
MGFAAHRAQQVEARKHLQPIRRRRRASSVSDIPAMAAFAAWRWTPRRGPSLSCPHWCTADHREEVSTTARPTATDPTWRLCHRRQVGDGAVAVVLYEVVDIWPDGSIAQPHQPDLSWNDGHAASPEAAVELAANLAAAAALLAPARA